MKKLSKTEDISTRYASIRARSGLTKKGFAESLGIHPVVSGDIELGKRDPSRDVLVRLARVYSTDLTWLLTGEVPGQGASPVVPVTFIRQAAAAGSGVDIEDTAEVERIPVLRSLISPWKSDRVRAVEVRGDSMTGIGLDDGDIVLFVPEDRRSDGVSVVSVNSRLLVKRVQFDQAVPAIHLISENPAYPVRVISG